MIFSTLKKRIYNDFFRPSRLNWYENLLKKAVNQGYLFYTIDEFNKKIVNNKDVVFNEKYFIIRHDIDTDPTTAYKIFLIEKKYSIKSTYYFRLSTTNEKLINEIKKFGSEVSYHYEEMATFAKRNKIFSMSVINDRIDEIRTEFCNNLIQFRNRFNVESLTIASHGDFMNIKLGHPNLYILNEEIRSKFNIELEAYDQDFMKYVTCRIADLGTIDQVWKSDSNIGLDEALDKNEKVIYLLIHPRQWYSRVTSNLYENFIRIFEEIKLHI